MTAPPDTAPGRGRPWGRTAAAAWAAVAVAAALLEAIVRLGLRGLAVLRTERLGASEWAVFAATSLGLLYFEGWRALHQRYLPKVVERVRAVAGGTGPAVRLSAPLYALALWAVERSALVRAWTGVLLIVAAVFLVRALPSPWRGLVDASVALALCVGLGSFLVQLARLVRAPARR